MSNIFNVEEAVECVIVIAELNHCVCGNTSGTRARYPCGHSACDACVASTATCQLCLTPPKAGAAPLHDTPATTRAANANTLLNSFQQAFNVNAYKKRKLSEQLKLEKEVFPQCIQAPMKYYNKRKSFTPRIDKENRSPSFLSGEQVSPARTSRMENSFNYVQQWLNNNDSKPSPKQKRQPLADLSTNTNKRLPRRADNILEKVKENTENNLKKRKKETPLKSVKTIAQGQSQLGQYLKPIEKNREFKRIKKDFEEDNTNIKKKNDRDESGIVMDDDPIVIDDSQRLLVDKDKLAWLAVLEAEEKDPYISSQQRTFLHNEVLNNTENKPVPSVIHKVPFYKKSYLFDTCSICVHDEQEQASDTCTTAKTAGQSKDVSITIESNSFTTTINLSTVKNVNKSNSVKHSVEIQTDITGYNTVEVKQPRDSEDLFSADVKNPSDNAQQEISKVVAKVPNEPSQLVIADSDSDDANESSIIQVTADVHHSFEEDHGVLAELASNDIQERSKRIGRGVTPNSSDSSDKENFDPNKGKRVKLMRKYNKKKRNDQFPLNPMFSSKD